MEHSISVRVKKAPGKGYGVFASLWIPRGAIIEKAPVLVVPAEHLVGGMHSPLLGRYFYWWGRNQVAIALGYGSLYNHSYKPNAHYEHGRETITFRALRDIDQGEEITVNYNGDPRDRSPVGFEVA
jgi:SET domain-containing protein